MVTRTAHTLLKHLGLPLCVLFNKINAARFCVLLFCWGGIFSFLVFYDVKRRNAQASHVFWTPNVQLAVRTTVAFAKTIHSEPGSVYTCAMTSKIFLSLINQLFFLYRYEYMEHLISHYNTWGLADASLPVHVG